MLLRSIGAALLTVGAAHGFKDSSPFVMLSSQPYGTPSSTAIGRQFANIAFAELRVDSRAR